MLHHLQTGRLLRHWLPKREGTHKVGRISITDRSADDIKYILELSLDLFNSIGLDNVTYLDIIVALNVKTAIHSHQNLLDIILEPLERAELACVYNDTVTDYADLRCSLKLTLTDDTSGTGTDL